MSVPMKPSDPAYWMLFDGHTTTPEVFRKGCYICEDPEFAQMGLPLCKPCLKCSGHVPADDESCDDCGADQVAIQLSRKEGCVMKYVSGWRERGSQGAGGSSAPMSFDDSRTWLLREMYRNMNRWFQDPNELEDCAIRVHNILEPTEIRTQDHVFYIREAGGWE